MLDINKAIEDIAKGLDELFTSDEERLKYRDKLMQVKLQIYQMQMDLQRDLIKRNTEVAKKSWLGRWPEMLAVAGIVILLVDMPIRALLAYFGIHFLDIDESAIIKMLLSLMGLK